MSEVDVYNVLRDEIVELKRRVAELEAAHGYVVSEEQWQSFFAAAHKKKEKADADV